MFMTVFHLKIKEFRKTINLTQKQMAERLNIGERAYQYYEGGQREPNLDTLSKISDTFDISIDYLLGKTNNPHSHKS